MTNRFLHEPLVHEPYLLLTRLPLKWWVSESSSEFLVTNERVWPSQVEASLPVRLRNAEREASDGFDGLEAISGSFGEGIDDGLRVSVVPVLIVVFVVFVLFLYIHLFIWVYFYCISSFLWSLSLLVFFYYFFIYSLVYFVFIIFFYLLFLCSLSFFFSIFNVLFYIYLFVFIFTHSLFFSFV